MKENKEHIIAEWLEGSVTDAELNTQYDTDIATELKLICDITNEIDIPKLNSQVLLQKIKTEITPQKSRSVFRKLISLKYWASAVAAIFVGAIAFLSLMNSNVSVDNNTLLYAMHTLPDGSTVHLNANSHIEYEKDFTENRNIMLDGEAFFDVQKGETFTIQTSNGDITVLGTSFNVFSRGNNLTVACKTGKVKVTTQSENILTPGENIFYIKDQLLEENVIDIEQIATWRDGVSKFKSSPFGEVVEAIIAQYDYEIKGASIDLSQRFTGSFIHNDIDKAIRMVFLPMGISYQLDTQNKIILIE